MTEHAEKAQDWQKTQTRLLERLSVIKRYLNQFRYAIVDLTGPEQEIWKQGLVVKGEVGVAPHPDYVTIREAREAIERLETDLRSWVI